MLADNLARLEERQLVRALPEAEPAYAFKHSLVQQTAYESLLVQERRALHRAVGEALEAMYADSRSEFAEVLAEHFSNAGQAERALPYARQAAERALRRFATAEAAALFGRAIALAREVGLEDHSVRELYLQRSRALELGGAYEAALAVYRDLEQLGQERSSAGLELAAVIGIATLHAVPTPLFDPGRALELAARAAELGSRAGEPAGQARAHWIEMVVQTRLDPQAAIRAGEAALAIARQHDLKEQEAFTLNDIQSNHQALGRPDRALQALAEARRIWRDLDNLPMLADNLASTAMLHVLQAAYDEALARAEEAKAISERIGNLWGQSYALAAMTVMRLGRGELGPAIRDAVRCIDLAEQSGFLAPQIFIRSGLAFAYGLAGDLGQAKEVTNQILVFERRHPLPGNVSGTATMAWIAAQEGDAEAAQDLLPLFDPGEPESVLAVLENPLAPAIAGPAVRLVRAEYAGALELIDGYLALFEERAVRAIRESLLLDRGRALLGLGRAAEARRAFEAALEGVRAGGAEGGLWSALIQGELARLATAEGRRDDARVYLAASADSIGRTAAGLAEVGLATMFLAQPHIRSILAQAESASG